jgi:hypothetical protein
LEEEGWEEEEEEELLLVVALGTYFLREERGREVLMGFFLGVGLQLRCSTLGLLLPQLPLLQLGCKTPSQAVQEEEQRTCSA